MPACVHGIVLTTVHIVLASVHKAVLVHTVVLTIVHAVTFVHGAVLVHAVQPMTCGCACKCAQHSACTFSCTTMHANDRACGSA